jgi:probable HAF family extracellular repeat protein
MVGNTKQMGRWFVIAVTIGLVYSTVASAVKPVKPPADDGGAPYTIVPFMPPEFASTGSWVSDLNEQGHAVGHAEAESGLDQALHLDMATGVYTSLQGGATATGVNNLNQIVGYQRYGGLFWSSPTAAPVDLPPLPGDGGSLAEAINDDGIVVGSSLGGSGDGVPRVRGVVWRVVVDANGDAQVDGPRLLLPLAGSIRWVPVDITETVEGVALAAGDSRFENFLVEAVVWTVELNPEDGALLEPGPPTGLGTLGLQDPSESNALGINDLGDVCGGSDARPYIAPAGEAMEPLPVTRDTYWGWAYDVNNLGEIVGKLDIRSKRQSIGPSVHYAYLWRNGEMIDLEKQIDRESGWDRLWGAYVVNDEGIIAGSGRFDGLHRGFLLIPNTP